MDLKRIPWRIPYPCRRVVPVLLAGLMLLVGSAVCARAQDGKDTVSAESQAQYQELSASLARAMAAEKGVLEELAKRSEELASLQKAASQEISALRVQLSAFSNLLSLSSAPVEDLTKAQGVLKQVLETTASRLKELADQQAELEQRLTELADQRSLNKKQTEDLQAQKSDSPIVQTLVRQLKEVNGLLQQKEKRLKSLSDKVATLRADWVQIQEEASLLQEKFTARINERKKEELFQRSRNPLAALSLEEIRSEVERLAVFTTRPFTLGFWSEQARFFWRTGGILLITSLLVFLIVEWILVRLRRLCRSHVTETLVRERGWYCLAVQLLARSLPLAGAVVFATGYGLARNLYDTFPPLRLLVSLLLLWLFTSWGIQFLSLMKERGTGPLGTFVRRRLRLALSVARWALLAYFCLQEVLGRAGALLLIYRFFLEVLFLAWTLAVGSGLKMRIQDVHPDGSRVLSSAARLFPLWLYGVATVGLLLELAGYGLLAVLWYAGWARTAVVGLWLFVCFMALREWEKISETASAFTSQNEGLTQRSFQWLMVRLLWVVWLFAGILGVLIAWGAKRAVILSLFRVLNTPVPIGGLSFRLSGLLYAVILLALTHVGTRVFKQALRSKVFRHSGLERGLQESITTISGYVLWFLGVLAALNALGFSGTSLTVAFGALGVGLGFGLQNIFNNFVSGLILLFERPIQVGDAIEVDGIWGEVKKINVRSTVIQTLDNASLIIPNSEFISGRVTNLSFKDLRLRRNIDVGVAYGSDVELVRRTLVEIADKHPHVFKKPEPSVLFLDFGDSALIFRLRFWTTTDACIQVETEIRFEIDRLFRERGIEIPFPQRDIHIRSVVPSMESAIKGEKDEDDVSEKDRGDA
ncbi:Small-conductance mechanosensitive channel [Desulfacinum hydrothermale DSM 13146]|uniref:Small-conductance mechanosensitive channel n=1 Tax=Desulfacinum hydrothermale DSM 13146 TaxID=1121390 RepID=A0A1W1XKW0_9BACT|nr:mechanosensitive ion channel domain-containing protein [Desulfacinum hydrothermale]SMC24434.1 Small-conductance mechanosensitive channel [Desulfacinum hydrothermale DSM 13146]